MASRQTAKQSVVGYSQDLKRCIVNQAWTRVCNLIEIVRIKINYEIGFCLFVRDGVYN